MIKRFQMLLLNMKFNKLLTLIPPDTTDTLFKEVVPLEGTVDHKLLEVDFIKARIRLHRFRNQIWILFSYEARNP